jgi:hypothetical protein
MLTFFSLILFYSLFFNDKKEPVSEKDMSRFHENSSPTILLLPDSSCQKIPAFMLEPAEMPSEMPSGFEDLKI